MSEELRDEIISINSIYGDDTLNAHPDGENLYILVLPAKPNISLRFKFPHDYPDYPPSILGTESVGDDVARGYGTMIVDSIRDILAKVFIVGSPCLFDLIVESDQVFHSDTRADVPHDDSGTPAMHLIDDVPGDDLSTSRWADDGEHDKIAGDPPPWEVSETVMEKKSVFVARAIAVTSVEQAKSYLDHLMSSDKKVARATHNITAWRIRGDNDVKYQDCDDDGETAAGGRLLHLLELMSVWNVMVVVTRWYGGVHLGSDRFRIINQVARDAVVSGGFVADADKEGKKKARK